MSHHVQNRSGFPVLQIDYDPADYNAEVIQQRLIDHKRTLLKKRDTPTVEDSTDWLQSSRTAGISRADMRTIDRRVRKYQDRKKALTGLGHLKAEERENLKKIIEGVNAAYITEAGADALAAELHAMYPWMAEATETVWLNLRRTAFEGVPARINPILLDGPPGIGKSAWSRSLAAAMNAPSLSIDAVAASTGFAIAGTERGWSSAQPGRPVQAILQHHHAGPVIVVDEVCKAASSNSTGGTRHNIQDSLLGLLEPVSAAHWECPFYRVRFDMSAISWILTSNDFAKIPEPLLTRCAVIRCGHLSNGELLTAGKSMAEKADLSAPSYDAAVTAIERTITAIRRPMNLRDVQRIVQRGASLQSKPMHN